MKKLFTLSILFTLAGIILSSCNTSSVMKRRYNKGYYVHHKVKPSEPKTYQAVADNKVKEPIMVAPKKAEQLPSVNNTDVITNGPVAAADIAIQKEAGSNAAAFKSNNKGLLRSIPAQYSVKKPVKALRNISTDLRKSSHADHDALSLLWILIVVLLVLYLIGLLTGEFGIGGLIHVLAVIILVLLILWLLRIL